MKYEFGVARSHHCSGTGVDALGSERFPTYEKAWEYARQEDECRPTIYIIIDEKYVFYCTPYAKSSYASSDQPVPRIYSIESKPWGQVETRIWWAGFKKNPSAFYHLAVGKIGG